MYKKQNEVDSDLSNIFKNLKRKDWGKLPLKGLKEYDPSAHYYPITYDFIDKSRAQIGCYSIKSLSTLKISVYNLKFAIVLRNS